MNNPFSKSHALEKEYNFRNDLMIRIEFIQGGIQELSRQIFGLSLPLNYPSYNNSYFPHKLGIKTFD